MRKVTFLHDSLKRLQKETRNIIKKDNEIFKLYFLLHVNKLYFTRK